MVLLQLCRLLLSTASQTMVETPPSSGKSVPCRSACLAGCSAAFPSRRSGSSWRKERLLWGLLPGAISKRRKPRRLGGFPQLAQSLRPRAALGFSSPPEEWPNQFALQWGLNACGGFSVSISPSVEGEEAAVARGSAGSAVQSSV